MLKLCVAFVEEELDTVENEYLQNLELYYAITELIFRMISEYIKHYF